MLDKDLAFADKIDWTYYGIQFVKPHYSADGLRVQVQPRWACVRGQDVAEADKLLSALVTTAEAHLHDDKQYQIVWRRNGDWHPVRDLCSELFEDVWSNINCQACDMDSCHGCGRCLLGSPVVAKASSEARSREWQSPVYI